MKRHIITAIVIILVAAIAVTAILAYNTAGTGGDTDGGGGDSIADGGDTVGGGNSVVGDSTAGKKQLSIFTFDKELEVIVKQYAKMHPEFDFNIVCRGNDMDFFYDLNYSLQNGGGSQVDLYCVPAAYAQWYVKGGYSEYACTYKELGIDVDAAIKKADIPQNIVDAGTNPNGELIALPYKKNVNLFMYHRSIAKEVWGTDDPNKIADIIGAGTGKWDRFLEAAQALKDYDCYMLPDCQQLSGLVETGISDEMLLSGGHDVDPRWEEYMELSKRLLENGFAKNSVPWSDEWIKSLNGKGDKPVFAVFARESNIRELFGQLKRDGEWAVCLPPVSVDTGFHTGFEDMDYYTGIMVSRNSPNKEALGPLIEWITLDSSETGLQHGLANDIFYGRVGGTEQQKYGGKRAVISGTVLNSTNNDYGCFDGQNINALIYDALQTPAGKHHVPGMDLFGLWYYETQSYLRGEKDKKTVFADYKKAVSEYEQSSWDMFEMNGFEYSADGRLYSLIDNRELYVYSYDDALPELIKEYVKSHPEFNFKVNWRHYGTVDEACTLGAINDNLKDSSEEAVDIYCVPDAYSHELIKGEYSKNACTYKELGIDIDAALKKADIPQYVIDAGTNPDGEVIALPYAAGVNVFMYRRSIAKDVWGTDDPNRIAEIIGSGTGKWDRFLEAAQILKEHGCYIVPGYWDLSEMIDTGVSVSGRDKGKGNGINPMWEEFADISKLMADKGYMTDMQDWWSDEWEKTLNGKGDKPVFGVVIPFEYFGVWTKYNKFLEDTAGDWAICVPPFTTKAGFYTGIMVNKDSPNKRALRPLIEWLTLDCSEEGLQYRLANDTLYAKGSVLHQNYGGNKAVVSGTVLKNTSCSIDFLGGQDINPVIYEALNAPTGKHDHYGPGSAIFSQWMHKTGQYINGEKDRKAAVADFKEAKKAELNYYKSMFEQYGISFLLP